MLDHVSFAVTDLGRSKKFYTASLAPFGYKVLSEFPGVIGMGPGGKPDLWIHEDKAKPAQLHVALASDTTAKVDAFHKAALKAGGKDNGPPGPRPDYGPAYYAAYVFDPDGHNIEAVCHKGAP